MPQILIVLAAVVVLGGGYFFFSSGDAPAENENIAATTPVVETVPAPVPVTPPLAPETTPPPAVVPTKKKYFDGQYSAEGSYVIPNQEVEKLTVSLTLKDGIVTAVDFTSNPEESGSKFNQKKFSDGYKALVVGKDIDTITLTVVNGSSLTPIGFTEALKAIKVKATVAA